MALATGRSQQAAGWQKSSYRVPREEWQVLVTWHPNILITGPAARTNAVLEALEAVFRPPVVCASARKLLIPPAGWSGTVILSGTESLRPADQRRLLAWLQTTNGNAQVAAVSAVALLPLVEEGAFDPALYYLLNVIYLPTYE